MSEVLFRGASGRLHRFNVHAPGGAFAAAPGVYVFARPAGGGRGWAPVFLSRTANLSARLARHERWAEAAALGATRVLVHQRDERDVREFVEADLLKTMNPALNDPMHSAAWVRPRLVWAA